MVSEQSCLPSVREVWQLHTCRGTLHVSQQDTPFHPARGGVKTETNSTSNLWRGCWRVTGKDFEEAAQLAVKNQISAGDWKAQESPGGSE